jgi:predicted nuclease of predicted toxin-antitoxin system
MKILLLDENLPATLSKDFSDRFQVFTVYDMGWQTMKDAVLRRIGKLRDAILPK